ncbi:hypothetical protein ACXET9_03350 [Brachybacterium sp. DNPG3]
MLPLLAEIMADPAAPALLADNSDGAVGIAFPFLAGPGVFLAVYLGIYRHYRNTDKRFTFEKKTDVAVGNLKSADGRRGTNNRQRSRRMSGANESSHLERVRRIRVE